MHKTVRNISSLKQGYAGRAENNWTKVLNIILVLWQLLSGFSLSHPIRCDCSIEEKGLLLLCVFHIHYTRLSPQRQSSESFCTSSCGTQSEWGRKPCRCRTTVYAIKKRMDNGEGVNMQTCTAVVERLLWIVTSCGMLFEILPLRGTGKQSDM